MANRISKHNYYLDIAQTVSERSTCLRKRYGAIIVKNDSILSTVRRAVVQTATRSAYVCAKS